MPPFDSSVCCFSTSLKEHYNDRLTAFDPGPLNMLKAPLRLPTNHMVVLHTCLVVLIHCCFALSVVVDVVRLLLSLSAVAVS